MRYMNDYDIEHARSRFTRASKPNRLGLAIMVERLAEWANTHSDGWAYWPKPARAADKAMALIESRTYAENEAQEREDATDAEHAAAVRPVKAFCTRMVNSGLMRPEERDLILRSTAPMFEVI